MSDSPYHGGHLQKKIEFDNKGLFFDEADGLFARRSRVDEELDFSRYAEKFELAGSSIKEIVTNAAYLAAAAGRGITNADVREAIKIHYLKSGKSLTRRELGEE